jgi:hypothetical protein
VGDFFLRFVKNKKAVNKLITKLLITTAPFSFFT